MTIVIWSSIVHCAYWPVNTPWLIQCGFVHSKVNAISIDIVTSCFFFEWMVCLDAWYRFNAFSSSLSLSLECNNFPLISFSAQLTTCLVFDKIFERALIIIFFFILKWRRFGMWSILRDWILFPYTICYELTILPSKLTS